MKNTNDMTEIELLREIVEDNRKKKFYTVSLTIANSVIAVVILVIALLVVPKTVATLNNVNKLAAETSVLVEKAQGSLTQIDEMVERVDKLVDDNIDMIDSTLKKFDELKLDSSSLDELGKTVDNLSKAVEPLGKLFGIIRD